MQGGARQRSEGRVFDAAVVGGGHNGLVCACYQARAGLGGGVLERCLGLMRGNVMHVEMDFDQMFLYRPLPELTNYRTPIENLYLTDAPTHSGGGVFAASGRNMARVVLEDVQGGAATARLGRSGCAARSARGDEYDR